MFRSRAAFQCVFALVLAFLATAQLAVIFTHEPKNKLADLISRGSDVSAKSFSANFTILAAAPSNTACRIAPLNSELTISLYLADQSIIDNRAGRLGNLDELNDRLAIGKQAVRNLLLCSPTDGNAWLRSGLLTAYRDGFSGSVPHMIERSQLYAPHEGRVLNVRLTRIPLLVDTSPAGLQLDVVRQRDLAVVEFKGKAGATR